MRSPTRLARIASLALLLSFLSLSAPAFAQTPRGLKTHMRLVNSMNGQTSPGEWRGGDGWTTTRPLVTQGVNNVSNALGMYSNSDFTAIADYGVLRFYGYGSGASVPYNGLFLWVDDWIGAEPRAQYRDRLYVTSASLPPGTPAVVQFQLTLSGSTTIVDTNPSSSFSAIFYATDPSPAQTLNLSLADAPGVTSGLFNTWVGDSIDVHGRLAVYLYAYGMMGGGLKTGSIAADVTAQVGAVPLTAGVSLTSNSNTVDVPAPMTAAFALQGAQPNPTRGTHMAIRFTLPSTEPAVLSLIDLSGRRVAETSVGGLGAGTHVVDLAEGRVLAPGVYLVRLAGGREIRTARAVVLD